MFLARSPMRSRSFATRSAPTTSRRSTAIGWRRAMVSTAFSSISCCSLSTATSLATTRWARSASRSASASTASATCFSASPPISATMRVSSCRSTSKALAVCSFIMAFILHAPLAEPTGDVVLRTAVTRRGEHLAGGIEFDQLAQIHEGGEVGHARRLLHVVGDDDDRVVLLQFVDQLLDLGGRDRVESGAGLVEQDHVGLDRDRARDAPPLLLAAGQRQPVGTELVLDLVPERRTLERMLDPAVEFRFRQLLVEADAEGDVLVDGHRERRRLLEHHADAGAQDIEVLPGRKNVLAVEQHLAGGALVGIEVVHPVEHAQQRGLAAAGGPDEGGDLVLVERDVDVLQRPMLAIEEIEVADGDL